ncbi:MAG TPA: hypothetical protein VKO42_01320, partial [Patescibacteria group bacterium]|nr:hypothetical protein [Patescibacteria group bacterium]
MNRIDGDPEEPRSGSDRSTFRSYEILDGVFLFGGGNIEQLVGEVTGEDREILLRYDTFRDVPPPIP